MKVLVIEDEKPAARMLMRLLERSEQFDGSVYGPLGSIKECIDHFKSGAEYDLIFMDIHLADGPSFDIFESVKPKSPIIFCTAFDQYALEAFKLNSIDYLLKPIEPSDLDRALTKYREIHYKSSAPPFSAEALLAALEVHQKPRKHKNRFVLKLGDRILVKETESIALFHSADKATFLQDDDGKEYPMEYSLDQLESMLDPEQYFRINRKYLIRLRAIVDMRSYSGSRIKLQLKNSQDTDVLVSRERTSDFKLWLDH
jgi:DNA-binding LytR/AlgR family response regulator